MSASPPSRFEQRRVFLLNEPETLRISPALAKEIGLNESILFLQLEFWIAVYGKERDGRRWYYASVRGLAARLPFWSFATINRTIKSLIDRGLVVEGNYNEHGYDRTRWLAINLEGCARIKSLAVRGVDTVSYQNETLAADGGTQDGSDTPMCQNDTATPEEQALCQNDTSMCQNDTSMCQNDTSMCQNDTTMCQNDTSMCQNDTTIPESLKRESLRDDSRESRESRERETAPAAQHALSLGTGDGRMVPPTENVPKGDKRGGGVKASPAASEEPAPEPRAICPAAQFVEEAGRVRLLPLQVDMIQRQVTEVVRWRRVVKRWLAHGYRATNVDGMLDWYAHPDKMANQCHDMSRGEEMGLAGQSYVTGALAGRVLH